ncbi:PREDICTED: uncharacterized protein LOC109216771 [Nicotiana attenuata]|uniref:DUF220 domain-containing protein n=1 Tax=Nicotiana attenuata TaxID=49451 RepID=A0A1J6JZA2_NICAT|nr:PREDICTED: uncharacterized protein LOC109216771 [Nicotiana attenuata]XP_019236496.1 PREDICTED: uncharacterized protein LOC109216771 [Nicotiana attenuata]XP_019236497.1 PREDICTED: uncharacterized protein LOC109216771 [Nicotiana attenuata]XP_019236498.1 PREDICTED: uncharacterized protein LOC109216771 [Nicotiana attenuata]OIT23090.1 hypothetical protein A4A49_28889 [Nicotiana attenuata]
MRTEGQSTDILENTSNVHNKLAHPMIHSFFSGFQEKVQECVKSNFKRLKMGHDTSISSIMRGNNRGASAVIDVDKEKQLQSWKENPRWVDQPPDIKVSVPKGSLCNLSVKVNVGLPPETVYDIVTDPENKRVFKNIKEVVSRKVLVDEGLRQVVELEQAAIWRFLWWSGTIAVHVLVDQNRENHTMNFKQVKTGFMKRFEGSWRVEPLLVDKDLCHPFRPNTLADYISYTKGKGRIGSTVSLEQLIQPAIVPPPPISWYLRGITTKTTEMIITDLLAEAARIRGSSNNDGYQGLKVNEESSVESQVGDIRDIKERWALRRRMARHRQRRLSSIAKSS